MGMALLVWHHTGGCSALLSCVAPSLPALLSLMLVSIGKVSHEESMESVLCYGINSWCGNVEVGREHHRMANT